MQYFSSKIQRHLIIIFHISNTTKQNLRSTTGQQTLTVSFHNRHAESRAQDAAEPEQNTEMLMRT